MSQLNDKKIIEKQKILNAINGCQDNLCLSKDCKNYLKISPFMVELRKNKTNCLKYVLAQLKTGQIQVDCAIPKQKYELIEQLKEYQELFDFNFQEVLNMDNRKQEEKFNSLEHIIDRIENEIEANSREKILKHLDRALENQFNAIKNVIKDKVKNLQFFISLTKLLICFKNFFTLENFIILENFNKFLTSLNFQDIYDNNFSKFSQRTSSLDKQKILMLIENVQNTITCTKYFVEEISLLSLDQQDQLVNCFQVLEYFYHVNKQDFYPEKINITEFQNDDILSEKEYKLEVIRVIIRASKEKNIDLPVQLNGEIKLKDNFNFLNWSFFYSAAQKVDLLHFESKILQQFEMQSSFQNLMQNPILLLQNGVGGIYLELNLDRNTILEDTLNQLHSKGKGNNLKKTLKIKFKGEPGVDEGGLTKEFFQILIGKLFDPNFGMFETKNNNRFMWFNKNSFECNLNFELIGMLLGIALYNATILKLNFPLAIYKKLKNVELDESQKKINYIQPQIVEDKITLEDLKEFEPELYVSFTNLLKDDYSNQQTGFNFQVTYLSWGETIDHDLIENGGDIEVTEENKQQFVDEYLKWFFRDSIKKQFEPFAVGFHKVLTGELIKTFSANDLYLSICGSETLDFKELKKTTKYDDGYKEDSLTIKHFWSVLLHDFDETQQKNFLKFLTGSDRAPLRGLSDIKLVISRQGDGNQLPAAHTCFNHLLLPDYQNYDKLKEKLLKSIQHFEGFGLF